MSSDIQYQKTIIAVNDKVNELLASGANDESILVGMIEYMPSIKKMIDLMDNKKLDLYYQEYEGFFYFMKLLEELASGIASGKISVPK
jgi:hypothetical protein